MNKIIKFKIDGMHCNSCKVLIEEDLKDLPGVINVLVNYQTGDAQVDFDNGKVNRDQIFSKIRQLKYEPQSKEEEVQTEAKKSKSGYLKLAIFAAILAGGYFLVSYFGGFEILGKLTSGYEVGFGIIFLIGLLSGFHCIGMCGSIVVSYSTMCLGDNSKSLWPHWQYNIGRILSYTIIGAILGGFGAFFGINPTFNGIVTILAGVFMFFLGLSLVSKSPWLEKLKFKTPQFIAKYIFSQKGKKSAPLIIGLLNGFMPCGPLQAMQIYALTSGNALKGALSLFLFAFGTSVLMFGFGAFLSAISQKTIKNILKFSGILVIVLSLFMVLRGLANFGVNLTMPQANPGTNTNQTVDNSQVQEVKMDVTYYGYEPNIMNIKKDISVRWVINVKQMTGCNSQILLEDYNIRKNLKLGENIIEFTPTKSGELKFSCGMRMIWGKFIVE
jgi:sulfite exporter TauE/SafE/copper chaperone CopZ